MIDSTALNNQTQCASCTGRLYSYCSPANIGLHVESGRKVSLLSSECEFSYRIYEGCICRWHAPMAGSQTTIWRTVFGFSTRHLTAARKNYLLAVPALFYAINNYLKFIMQLFFNPATVKMLSNLKVLVIALLLKAIMKRRFTVMQWEALTLLLIGISVN